MSYLIAAYVVVLGCLVVYGVRVHLQRRALLEEERRHGASSEGADS